MLNLSYCLRLWPKMLLSVDEIDRKQLEIAVVPGTKGAQVQCDTNLKGKGNR
jgi:hypothetical protein